MVWSQTKKNVFLFTGNKGAIRRYFEEYEDNSNAQKILMKLAYNAISIDNDINVIVKVNNKNQVRRIEIKES